MAGNQEAGTVVCYLPVSYISAVRDIMSVHVTQVIMTHWLRLHPAHVAYPMLSITKSIVMGQNMLGWWLLLTEHAKRAQFIVHTITVCNHWSKWQNSECDCYVTENITIYGILVVDSFIILFSSVMDSTEEDIFKYTVSVWAQMELCQGSSDYSSFLNSVERRRLSMSQIREKIRTLPYL